LSWKHHDISNRVARFFSLSRWHAANSDILIICYHCSNYWYYSRAL
jgi:hypothetical protein